MVERTHEDWQRQKNHLELCHQIKVKFRFIAGFVLCYSVLSVEIAIIKLVGASHSGNVAQATIAISMQIERDIARCHAEVARPTSKSNGARSRKTYRSQDLQLMRVARPTSRTIGANQEIAINLSAPNPSIRPPTLVSGHFVLLALRINLMTLVRGQSFPLRASNQAFGAYFGLSPFSPGFKPSFSRSFGVSPFDSHFSDSSFTPLSSASF